MASEGGEGASGTGGGASAGAGGEGAASAPAMAPSVGETAAASVRSAGSGFTPRSLDRAEKQAARVADRWAPESAEALRAPALRSLSFVDRLLAPARPFLGGPGGPISSAMGARPAGTSERVQRAGSPEGGGGGTAWWLFPTPWYVDALASIQGEVARTRPMPSWQAQAARDADVAMGRVPLPSVEPARSLTPPSMPVVAGDMAPAPVTQTFAPPAMPAVRPPSVAETLAPRPSAAEIASAAPPAPTMPEPIAAPAMPPPVAAPIVATPAASPIALTPEAAIAPTPGATTTISPAGSVAGTFAPPTPSAAETLAAAAPIAAETPAPSIAAPAPVVAAEAAAAMLGEVAAPAAPTPPSAAGLTTPAPAARAPAVLAPPASSRAAAASTRVPPAGPTPMPLAVPVALAALRAWTPLVPAAAAQAAEQLLGRLTPPAREPRQTPDTSSLIRALVAPDEGEPLAPRTAPPARAAAPAPARLAAEVAAAPSVTDLVAPATPAPATAPTPAYEAPVAAATPTTPETATPELTTAPAAPIAAAPVAAVPSAPIAAPAAPLWTAPAAMPPAAGPRVLLPAGLSGLSAGLGAASLVQSAIERVAPIAATPAPARPTSAPGPLAHVAWADAWLTRMAGAPTPPAGGAEAPTALATAARALLSHGAPAQIFLAPPEAPTPASLAAAAVSPTAAPPAIRPAVPGMPVVASAAEAVPTRTPAPSTVTPPTVSARPEAPAMPVIAPSEIAATSPAARAAQAPAAPVAPPSAPAAMPAVLAAAPAAEAPEAVAPSPAAAAAFESSLALLGAPSLGLPSGLGASPILSGLAAEGSPSAAAPLAGADVARAPLGHVAWADHWLARFVGAPAPQADEVRARPAAAVGAQVAPGVEPVYVSPETAPAATPTGRAPALPTVGPAAAAPVARPTAAMPVVSPETAPPAPAAARPTAPTATPVTPTPLAAAAPTPTPAPVEAAAPAAPAGRAPAPTAEPAPRIDLGEALPPTGWAAWAPPPAVAGAPAARSFSPGLPAALMASPMAAHLAEVLGVAPHMLSGTGTLIERLRGPSAGRAPATWATPSLVYPELPSLPGDEPVARAAGRAPAADLPRAAAPAAAPVPATEQLAPTTGAAAAPTPAPSMRPGAIGSRAELFAAVERLRASDLSLDFVSPELVEAAQIYGFGAADATRAAHLAEAGFPVLSALTTGANLALLQLETGRPAGAAAATRGGPSPAYAYAAGPGGPAATPASAPLFRAPDLVPLVPGAQPRGAFAVSKVARDTLARQKPESAWPSVMPTELAALDLMAASAVATDGGGTDRLTSARTAFDADYVSLGSFGVGSEPGPGVPPMVPAARALARASGHALDRPVFNVDMPSAPMVSVGATEIPVHEVASALRMLVAPVMPTSVSGGFVGRAPISGGQLSPLVAPPAPEPIRTGTDTRPAASGGSPDFPLPDWFEAAAKKLLGGDRSDDKFGIPELTLIQSVSSSPSQRIAAKEVGETAAAAPPAEGGAREQKKEDIEQIARDVYAEIRRMYDAALLRSGGQCP